MLNRAYSIIDVKSVSEEQRVIRGVATTPSPDRAGDIVEPLGVKFANPLPLLHQHNSAAPVGTVTFDKPTKRGITFTAKFAQVDGPPSLVDRIEAAWAEVKAGLIRGVSIGFKSLKRDVMDGGGIHFQETEVLELSLVTIPMNSEATISVIKSIDADLLAASGHRETKGAPSVDLTPAGVTARTKPVVKAQEARQMSKRTIADAIASFEATVAAKKTAMTEIMEKSIEGSETLSTEDQDAYDALELEMKSALEHVERLKKHDALNRATATEVRGATAAEATASRTIPAQVRATPKPLGNGTGFVRFVQCLINAKGDMMLAERMAMQRANQWDVETPGVVECIKYCANMGHSRFDMDMVRKTAVGAGTTTDSTFASPLVVYQNLQNEFIDYLRPATIIGRLPNLRRVPFKVKVPRQTGPTTVGWVGERSVKAVTSNAFDTVTLEHYKVAGIVVISEELARFSNPSAESIIRDDLRRSIVQYQDAQFVDPTVAAVTGVNPASITNGVTSVGSTGTTAAALRTDLANVLDGFTANNLSLGGVVGIMTETQAMKISMMMTSLAAPQFPGMSATGGSLMGIPIITSENIPATGGSPTDGYPIIFVHTPSILLADDGEVTVDASNQASLQMDTAPTSPPTTDTVPFSLWQHNCVGLRAERFIAWTKARTEAVQFISAAKYAE